MENANASTSVVTVLATDQDQDANGRVLYSITNGNTADAFEIDNQTGVVTVKGSINRENIKEYSLTIQAEDAGHPSSRKVRLRPHKVKSMQKRSSWERFVFPLCQCH